MKVLLVGGCRFLGEAIVRSLLAESHDVTVLALDQPAHRDHVRWLSISRHDRDLGHTLKREGYFDVVIDNIAFNGDDVTSLVSALPDVGRYVLTSSVDTYDHRLPALCGEKLERLAPTTTAESESRTVRYARGKRAAEVALKQVTRFETVVVRPGVLFGRRDPVKANDRETYGRSLYYPLRLLDGLPILLLHSDTRLYQVTWVDDAARALVAAAQLPGLDGLAFNLVNPTVTNTEGLVKSLCVAANLKVPDLVRVGPGYLTKRGVFCDPPYRVSRANPSSLFSAERAQHLLGARFAPIEEWGAELFTSDQALDTKLRTQEVKLAEEQLRELPPLQVRAPETEKLWSSVGIGTYRGEPTDVVDADYKRALAQALSGGINVIDTAVNYRDTRSELVIGEVVRNYYRERLVIVTKGGYVPTRLVKFSELRPSEVEHRHCIRANYVNISLRRSLYNLGTYVDTYLLHNPEVALKYTSPIELKGELLKTFALLEQRVADGVIKSYGVATWRGLVTGQLDLEELLELARIVDQNHHFDTLELPLNAEDRAALEVRSQRGRTVLELAADVGLRVLTSYSVKGGDGDDPLESLRFVTSHQAVTTALVGMRQPEHVSLALSVLSVPR